MTPRGGAEEIEQEVRVCQFTITGQLHQAGRNHVSLAVARHNSHFTDCSSMRENEIVRIGVARPHAICRVLADIDEVSPKRTSVGEVVAANHWYPERDVAIGLHP